MEETKTRISLGS